MTLIDDKIEEKKRIMKDLGKAQTLKERHNLEDKIDKIEQEISYMCSEEFAEKIRKHFKEMSSNDGKFSNNKMWKLKKKICPKYKKENITAKKDENGKLETDPVKLKKLYLKVYEHRLRQRKIKPGLEKLQKLRNKVFELRLKRAKK